MSPADLLDTVRPPANFSWEGGLYVLGFCKNVGVRLLPSSPVTSCVIVTTVLVWPVTAESDFDAVNLAAKLDVLFIRSVNAVANPAAVSEPVGLIPMV